MINVNNECTNSVFTLSFFTGLSSQLSSGLLGEKKNQDQEKISYQETKTPHGTKIIKMRTLSFKSQREFDNILITGTL